MAFCSNCGNKVGDNDKFCASCGAARAPGAQAAQPETPPPTPAYNPSVPMAAPATSEESSTGLKVNIAAMLCYVLAWITGIVFLILEKKSRFVRFHAAQSLVTFGFINILNGLIRIVFPNVFGSFLNGLIGLGGFILWVVLLVKAYQGETYKLPIAGDIASGIVGKA